MSDTHALCVQAKLASQQQEVADLRSAAQRSEQELQEARMQLEQAEQQLQDAEAAHQEALASQLQVHIAACWVQFDSDLLCSLCLLCGRCYILQVLRVLQQRPWPGSVCVRSCSS